MTTDASLTLALLNKIVKAMVRFLKRLSGKPIVLLNG